MIEVKNLVKRYGDHTAVDHLTFTAPKGQILGFLGPNGAGKSTTMNIITGYMSATEGTVTVDGVDIYEEPEKVKKMIGYLPEFPPLYPDMTVLEYLNFAADIKKVSKKEKKQMIGEIMEATGITPMADRLIKHLSKGYKQRVGLAQAIMGYPEVILLDEPTVGLDPKQIIEIRELIKKLSKNHTIILSSHIMQEVSAVCDSVLIIDKGRMILQDKPENLSTRLGSTGGLKLTVKGGRDKVLAELGKISRIISMEEQEPSGEGMVDLTVYCKENDDIREEVFYAMSEAKLPILEMHMIRMSLEDIFLKVTNKAEENMKYSEENDSENDSEERQSDSDSEEHQSKNTSMEDREPGQDDETDADSINIEIKNDNKEGDQNASDL
ncbi:MAG TPA: ABC transporter [Lachnospiraceae bacterium]|nr:ABC transporter [Lachnospiraceae bacterium]HBY70770.1 ABC transporter [Lachnospiraceae bacterium]HCM11925.1 ABC transporter [Lachnospiraceae bacterium]HCR41719.1 ABC transporter [Lachnospiraceae bacterium]